MKKAKQNNKTLKLLGKNYKLNSGRILIDDTDINELSENTIRNNISIVSQAPNIFNLSIKENIKLARH